VCVCVCVCKCVYVCVCVCVRVRTLNPQPTGVKRRRENTPPADWVVVTEEWVKAVNFKARGKPLGTPVPEPLLTRAKAEARG